MWVLGVGVCDIPRYRSIIRFDQCEYPLSYVMFSSDPEVSTAICRIKVGGACSVIGVSRSFKFGPFIRHTCASIHRQLRLEDRSGNGEHYFNHHSLGRVILKVGNLQSRLLSDCNLVKLSTTSRSVLNLICGSAMHVKHGKHLVLSGMSVLELRSPVPCTCTQRVTKLPN